MSVSTLDLVSLRMMPTGRRRYAVKSVRELASKEDLSSIVAACERALEHDQNAAQLEARLHRQQREAGKARQEGPSDAVALDRKIDRTLSSIDGVLSQWSTSGLDTAAKQVRDAEELRSLLFPAGVANITSRAHDEALPLLQDVLKRASTEEAGLAEYGVSGFVAALKALVPQFEAALAQDTTPPVKSADVRAADSKGNALLRAVVVGVLSELDDEQDPSVLPRRGKLLAPILRADAIMLRYNQQNRPAPDVNPDTGEELPEEN